MDKRDISKGSGCKYWNHYTFLAFQTVSIIIFDAPIEQLSRHYFRTSTVFSCPTNLVLLLCSEHFIMKLFDEYYAWCDQWYMRVTITDPRYIENNVCTSCFGAHERVILVFISRVAKQHHNNTKITLEWAQKLFVTRVHTYFCFLHDITNQ